MKPIALSCLWVALFLACGDPLVEGSYRGRELYVLEGWVRLDTGAATPPVGSGNTDAATSTDPGPLRVALFWAPAKGSGFHFEGAVEQDVATDGLFPARFRLALFAPPEDELVRPVADGTGDMAVAVVLAYLDSGRERHWDRDAEPVVGGAPDRLLVYSPLGVQSHLYGALPAGFSRVIPIKDCVPRPDGSGFETRYALDQLHDVDLYVSMGFPVELFFDANCDGSPGEWTGVCPPLDKVRSTCRSGGVVPQDEVLMCGACEPLLWPANAPPEACDDWLAQCLYRAPPEECDREWRACRGASPVGPDCVELPCVCQHLYDECQAMHHDDVLCKAKYNDCMTR